MCVSVFVVVTRGGDAKCHTTWDAGGFDVAHAPFPILNPKISPGHPIRWEGGGSLLQWRLMGNMAGLHGRSLSLSQLALSTWEHPGLITDSWFILPSCAHILQNIHLKMCNESKSLLPPHDQEHTSVMIVTVCKATSQRNVKYIENRSVCEGFH